MQYVHVAEFHIRTGAMEAFTSAVQRWERLALADPDGPLEHQVLLDSDRPSRVLVLTRFQDEDHAQRFATSSLPSKLMADVLSCCETTMSSRRYTVFYETSRDGHSTIFGREPKRS
jgi:heme-degrading monooxygenase HmoA